MIRYEVTEDPSAGVDGERIVYVPGRGLHRSTMSANGDLMVSEDRLRTLLAAASSGENLTFGLEKLLGTAWDDELEPYRYAGEGAPVTQLYQVG
jgi:hypothetical protein